MYMDDQIKTLVRLKYTISTDQLSWFTLMETYPPEVTEKLYRRWSKFEGTVDWHDLSVEQCWNLHSNYLFEELCEYESKTK